MNTVFAALALCLVRTPFLALAVHAVLNLEAGGA